MNLGGHYIELTGKSMDYQQRISALVKFSKSDIDIETICLGLNLPRSEGNKPDYMHNE